MAISSHDIDLIDGVSDTVHVLRQGEALAPGEVFARADRMREAGLMQPRRVKRHTQLALPRCKREDTFFRRMRHNAIAIKEAR
ncbi:ATPase component CbiO of energizing module of cobalt ECF transporter [Edwardsiella anguillarum ET080813]|uniref:ATPase component CbiO of energizing module of cobalt ECF transporter n=1 Tax=Edwardsiella anguillarum ET080813 TaxID=667120 RepID=A0A076LPB2_9GAMM|nr:ATPase component CbiO of energizing module of cobalt ECF transporter [Edwardsiella anguillarum ET080813]